VESSREIVALLLPMRSLRAVVLTAAVFLVVGPAIGAAVIWLQRPPGTVRDVVLLSYVFGGVPALIAGIAHGQLRVRGHASRWYTRAMLGAGAGLFGCLVFFLLVSAYDLVTVPDWTVGNLHLGFLRRLVLSGIPAGAVCALLTGSPRPRPGTRASEGG
jgi:hypothetical protein